MNSSQQRDDEARRRIREMLRQNFVVEAGAGTGKTRAMVERFTALVLEGHPVENIVAITFTERAAAELRDRVRDALERSLACSDEDDRLLRQALESLDRAQISTIHSFCQSVLHAFAPQAGIDPTFTVMDEVAADRRFEERWRAYLEDLNADPQAVRAIDRVLSLGLTTADLQRLVRELLRSPDVVSRLRRNPIRAPVPQWPNIGDLLARLDGVGMDAVLPDDRLRLHLQTLRDLLADLHQSSSQNREEILAAAVDTLKGGSGGGSSRNWGGKDAIEKAREVGREISDQLRSILDACRAHALADLLQIVLRFLGQDEAERGRTGLLTFDDLIVRVRDLLITDAEAVAYLRRRYHAMLIDEFQDTDPIQVDIALAFATDPATGRLEPGRLFAVGDPKQSIYRFRRADMAVYSRTVESLRSDGGFREELAVNRRSRPELLHWVNQTFTTVIGDDDDPQVQPPYRAISAQRNVSLAGPGVAWFGGPLEAKARGVRLVEAKEVADRCRAVLQEGWQVEDRNDGTVRPAAYRDIAILIPTRTILAPLERALAEAGVPYRIEGGSLVYRTQEVRDLLNCLTAIDDPADEVAIVGALRGVAFACSDVELASHNARGGSFNYTRPLRQGEPRVLDALRTLHRYHQLRHQKSIAALVEEFASERRLAEVGIADAGDRDAFRRVRFVIEQARAFEAEEPQPLRAFVAWMTRRDSGEARDTEGSSLDEDEDAVRVMTIHAAKGLEFPIVVLAGLGARQRNTPPGCLLDRNSERIAVKVGSISRNAVFKLGPYDHLVEVEERHARAEEARLLYVAATRARDHLLVSIHHQHKAKDCPARRLIEAGIRETALEHQLPASLQPVSAAPFAGVVVDLPRELTVDQFWAEREQLARSARRERYTSATALKVAAQEGAEDENPDETEPWARGRGGTHLGRAVHAAIQSLPLDPPLALIEAFSRAQAVAEAIPHRESEVAGLVRRALASQAAQRAREATRAMREVPFAFRADGVTVEGFIDLLLETPDGIEIVDWKTDAIAAEEVPKRLQQYELQAGLYVLGVEAATGRMPTRVTYVFVSAGVEVSLGDPAGLRDRALHGLSTTWK